MHRNTDLTAAIACALLAAASPAAAQGATDSARASHVLDHMFSPLASGALSIQQMQLRSLPGVSVFVGRRLGPHGQPEFALALVAESAVIPLGSRPARQVAFAIHSARLVRGPTAQYAVDLGVLDGVIPFGASVVRDTVALPPWARREVQRRSIPVMSVTRRTRSDGAIEMELYVWAESLWLLSVRLAGDSWHDAAESRLIVGNPPG